MNLGGQTNLYDKTCKCTGKQVERIESLPGSIRHPNIFKLTKSSQDIVSNKSIGGGDC